MTFVSRRRGGFRDAGASVGSLSDGQLLLLMVCVWLAAMAAIGLPLVVGLTAMVCGMWFSGSTLLRTALVVIGVCAVASTLAASAEDAYQPAPPRTLTNEPAVLVTDIEPSDFGWRAEGRLDSSGERVQLVGIGFEQPDLGAGQPVSLSGRLAPITENDWYKSRHLVGVVSNAEVAAVGRLAWFRLPGEWLRSGVLGATSSFSDGQAALYHGLVIGDDRFQSEGQRAQFRAAGLSHLLAVSGQNVSFLLAVFAPFTARLRPPLAFGAVVALLVIFALATRLEPSVLRATVTAGVSTFATMRSAKAAGVRALSLAVVGLLMVDPFLAWSIGFRLSVGASVGILLLAPVIKSRLAGPRWITEPMAITLAAQVGVSPLLLAAFGPVASVTVPANLLAGWAAGAVMTLGLSVGLVASVLPDGFATWVQMPARGLVWWIDAVAAGAATAPLPDVSASAVPWLVVALLGVWWLRPGRLFAGWWVVPLTVAALATASDSASMNGWHPATRSSPSVLIIEDPNLRWVELVVDNRITAVELVIVADGGWSTARAIAGLREVLDIGVVLAPPDHSIVGGRRVLEDLRIGTESGWIDVSTNPSRLDIEIVVVDPPRDG